MSGWTRTRGLEGSWEWEIGEVVRVRGDEVDAVGMIWW